MGGSSGGGGGSGGRDDDGVSAAAPPAAAGGKRAAAGDVPASGPLPLPTALRGQRSVFSVSREPSPPAAAGGRPAHAGASADGRSPGTPASGTAADVAEPDSHAMDRGGDSDSDVSMDSGSFHLSDADDEEEEVAEAAPQRPGASLPTDVDGGGGGTAHQRRVRRR